MDIGRYMKKMKNSAQTLQHDYCKNIAGSKINKNLEDNNARNNQTTGRSPVQGRA